MEFKYTALLDALRFKCENIDFNETWNVFHMCTICMWIKFSCVPWIIYAGKVNKGHQKKWKK